MATYNTATVTVAYGPRTGYTLSPLAVVARPTTGQQWPRPS